MGGGMNGQATFSTILTPQSGEIILFDPSNYKVSILPTTSSSSAPAMIVACPNAVLVTPTF